MKRYTGGGTFAGWWVVIAIGVGLLTTSCSRSIEFVSAEYDALTAQRRRIALYALATVQR
jgi:hypothetical protein